MSIRTAIKTTLQILSACIIAPFTLSYYLLALAASKDALLTAYSQLLSLLPGKLGVYLRAGFYRFTLTKCSPDAVVSFAVLLSQKDIEISPGVYIGPQCNIGKCSIGDDTLLGSGVHIMSGKGQHNFDQIDVPIREQGGRFVKVTIGQNCWIGNGALVMSNIGNNCIVAAGSVVVDDVPDNTIVAGNPAKIIKTRN